VGDFEADDRLGFAGDKPSDGFSSGLPRIAQAYEERFGRKPRLTEVLQAFEQVIDADPSRYPCDVEEGEAVRLRMGRHEG
jgi:hypothetical protein